MIVEKSSLNRLHREKIDTIPEFRRSGCSAPVPERQLSETSSPSLSVSLTSSSTLPRWMKVLLQIARVYVNLCIVLSEGLLQQLRNQEEGRVGACGQVQQINIGPTWFWLDFWGWNENPSPTSAYTWKYLLVHAKLPYMWKQLYSCRDSCSWAMRAKWRKKRMRRLKRKRRKMRAR